MTAWLTAQNLRVDVDGVPAFERLSFDLGGERTLLVGAPAALFEACAGLRDVVGGSLLIEGRTPRMALDARAMVAVSMASPLPVKWTVLQYVSRAAALFGQPAALTESALRAMQLQGHASARIGKLPITARNGVLMAAALATGATTVLLSDPLAGVPEEWRDSFADIVCRALEPKRWAVFASHMAIRSPLTAAAGDVLLVSGGQVVARGTPAEVTSTGQWLFRTRRNRDALVERLLASGIKASATGDFIDVALDQDKLAADVFALALEADAPIVEMSSRAGWCLP